jgi:toxin ParE1/3/4
MSKSYIISNKAKNDLIEIWSWTNENFSEEQADTYYFKMLDKISQLTFELDRAIAFEQEIYKYNFIRFKSHYIFYIHNSEEKIKIVRILHQNRNFTKFLK